MALFLCPKCPKIEVMRLIVTIKEMKNYLRVDYDDDNTLILRLIDTAENLCMEILRIDDRADFTAEKKRYKIAVMFAVAYLYEKREEADYNELKLTLRAFLANYRTEGF